MKEQEIEPQRRCFKLLPGMDFNPLLSYPRNKGCFCGSGTKFKRCCCPRQPRAIPIVDANRIKENWGRLMTGHLLIKPPEQVSKAPEGVPMPEKPWQKDAQ